MTEQLPASTHAKLSASGAYRWLACPGSVKAAEGIPDTTSEYAAEGTVAHEIAARVLTGAVEDPYTLVGQKFKADGFEIECTEEMAEAVMVYVDAIKAYAEPGDIVEVECDLTPALRKLHPEFGGTSDCVVYKPEQKRLGTFDLKYGSGVMVSALNNIQLRYYAIGALLTGDKPVDLVDVFIVQPRIDTEDGCVRSESFRAVDLIDLLADLLEGAGLALSDNAPLNPGDHCRFCKAAAICPALEKMNQELMAEEFAVEELAVFSPEKLAQALDAIPMVEERCRAIRERAYELAAQGTPIPGHKLVAKRAHRKWLDEEAARAALANVIEDESKILVAPKLKTPAQVEKVLPKALKKLTSDPSEGLISKESSGYNLVPESDSRPPAQLASPDDFETNDAEEAIK